jgi:hypothetical protein
MGRFGEIVQKTDGCLLLCGAFRIGLTIYPHLSGFAMTAWSKK